MKRACTTVLFSCLLVTPLLAQTTIGGGTCSSASVNGPYAVSITGRQVSSSGTFGSVIQANGSATFDGLSKISLALTADTNQAVATPLTWSGTYTMQANCAGVVNITTGGSATFNIVLFSVVNGSAPNFLLSGSDATYTYAGNGNKQPATCSTSLLTGVYTFNATGFALTGTAVSGPENGAGLLQFDGQGHLTVNFTLTTSAAAATPITLIGTYSVGSNCLGTATLSDSTNNPYVMNLSITSSNFAKTFSGDLFAALAQNSKFIVIGAAHAIFGQPTSELIIPKIWARPALSKFVELLPRAAYCGERA
jgi:hypothetical protein